MMARFPADRRLYVTADRDRVVEEGDPDAAFLLCPEGRYLEHDDIEAYGLEQGEDGSVIVPGQKQAAKPEDKMVGPPENKAAGDELPDDFPGVSSLRDAGIETYADLKALNDVTDVNGIGPATAEDIADALGG